LQTDHQNDTQANLPNAQMNMSSWTPTLHQPRTLTFDLRNFLDDEVSKDRDASVWKACNVSLMFGGFQHHVLRRYYLGFSVPRVHNLQEVPDLLLMFGLPNATIPPNCSPSRLEMCTHGSHLSFPQKSIVCLQLRTGHLPSCTMAATVVPTQLLGRWS
jgi:hypothetical protein